jgi:hypothetical protein
MAVRFQTPKIFLQVTDLLVTGGKTVHPESTRDRKSGMHVSHAHAMGVATAAISRCGRPTLKSEDCTKYGK